MADGRIFKAVTTRTRRLDLPLAQRKNGACRRKSTPAFRSANCDRKPGPCQAGRSLTDGQHSATRGLAQEFAALMAANRYEWERVVRRARIGAMPKYVGMVAAQYGNRDGTSIRPGVARLMAVTELSERTVRGALTELRQLGLLQRTREGSSRGRQALTDEYELAIPGDMLDRIPMLDPDESPAPDAAVRVPYGAEHRQEVHPPPAPGAGTPAPGAGITGRRCTPPNHDQPLDLTNNQRGTSFGAQPTTGATTVGPNNVIPFDRRAQ